MGLSVCASPPLPRLILPYRASHVDCATPPRHGLTCYRSTVDAANCGACRFRTLRITRTLAADKDFYGHLTDTSRYHRHCIAWHRSRPRLLIPVYTRWSGSRATTPLLTLFPKGDAPLTSTGSSATGPKALIADSSREQPRYLADPPTAQGIHHSIPEPLPPHVSSA